jgi:hypothetical protein
MKFDPRGIVEDHPALRELRPGWQAKARDLAVMEGPAIGDAFAIGHSLRCPEERREKQPYGHRRLHEEQM